MAQNNFFDNLNTSMKNLEQARKNGIISIQQEEEHLNNMLSMYDAINAKKAAGREWDLKTQSIWGNLKRFGKEMADDAENLKKAKKSLKKTEDEINKLGEVQNELAKRGNKAAADMVKKKKEQLEIEKEIQEVNYETAKSSVGRMGKAFNAMGKVGGFMSSNFGFLGGIFKSILGTVWDIAKGIFDIIFPIEKAWKLFLELQKAVGNLSADIGMTHNEYKNLLHEGASIYNEIIGYGGKIEDIAKVIRGFSEETGKNRIFSKEEITDIVKLGYSTGLAVEGVTKMVAEFDNLGYSLATTMKIADKGRNVAARFNLNQTKVLRTTTEVVKNLTGTAFGRSTEDLTKLAAKAETLRFNLAESIKSFKDAFFSPEKAVEAAAKIQVLGGEFAQMFGNPFDLMNDSMNNADGMAEKLINSAKSLAVKNKNGEFIIPPAQRQILREVAESLGQDYDNIVNAAIEQARVGDKMQALAKSGLSLGGFNEEDRLSIANLMTMNKNGQYEIKMANGVPELISNITSEDQIKNILAQRKANEKAAQERLNLSERFQIVLDRFAIGLTPLFENLNRLLEDEGTLQKIEDLGKGIADSLIPFINDLFKPGGFMEIGISDILKKFNEVITHIRSIMNGDGTFFDKITQIFGEIASFVVKGLLPYIEYTFGHIMKVMGQAMNIDFIKNAGEKMIASSFTTDGKRNEALIAMHGGEAKVQQQMGRANKAYVENADTGAGTYAAYTAAGAATGAMFGPWGALIGAGVGLLGAGLQDIFETDDKDTNHYTLPPVEPVNDAIAYANGRVFKGGKGDAIGFFDELALSQAQKGTKGGVGGGTITVNVSGTIEHDSEDGKRVVTAEELYKYDPQMFGRLVETSLQKYELGGNNTINFGVTPIGNIS